MGAALRRILVDGWQKRGLISMLLRPAALCYGAVFAVRSWLYQTGVCKTERVPVPVIVVGNVVAGGSGKTPLVMAIVCHLQARGIVVGVVSRGYGRSDTTCREVLAGSLPTEVGDEPLLVHRSTGAVVFVATRRIDAARALLRQHPTVGALVCDDGLQHHALHRDLEICVFGRNGVGNGLLLPAGPLREPWPRPVNLVVYDGDHAPGNHAWRIRRCLSGHARRADGAETSLRALGDCGGRPDTGIWAVAGIAQPEVFFAMLRDANIPLTHTVALPDHAVFDTPILPTSQQHTLLCTEKDAVKLWRHHANAWAVPLELHIPAGFWDAFDHQLQLVAGAKLSSPHGYTTA